MVQKSPTNQLLSLKTLTTWEKIPQISISTGEFTAFSPHFNASLALRHCTKSLESSSYRRARCRCNGPRDYIPTCSVIDSWMYTLFLYLNISQTPSEKKKKRVNSMSLHFLLEKNMQKKHQFRNGGLEQK